MDKKQDFELLLKRCRTEYNGDDGMVIGQGNPEARVMFVGREASGDVSVSQLLHIEKYGPCIPVHRRNEETGGQSYWKHKGVWWNYQKLADEIWHHREDMSSMRRDIIDFEQNVFCTEASQISARSSRLALNNCRHNGLDFHKLLQERKSGFFSDSFFKGFDVILLACGNYFVNDDRVRDIDTAFNVRYVPERSDSKMRYWVHLDSTGRRMVIHTRNLVVVSTEFIKTVGNVIRGHLQTVNV